MALFTASGLLALVTPTDAQAASAHCPGRKIRTFTFSTGKVLVFKNRGYVCAVTLPKRTGKRQWMSVSVQARGNWPVVNEGKFTRYAGPVNVHVGHRRILIRGAVGGDSVTRGWFRC
ncbi:hypothetical protein [Streptomyces cavernae]|uniref:hypothetical protein n=1 Tax=Streptomyces cavernae TaxID=2259034 RepID=UPI000FEB7068|nr:hypothetical protein [Streptomyces cavernae]